LKNLTDINLSINKINDLSALSDLQLLKHVSLSFNDINDLSVLSKLKNLEYFTANQNKITTIEALRNLNSLNTLSIYYNKIEDISPLKTLTKLTYLDLGNNIISDLSPLIELSELKTLYMGYNKIADASLLANLNQLNNLSICNNPISTIAFLKYLTNLTYLNMLQVKISDFSSIYSLTKLTAVELLDFNKLDDLVTAIPDLKSIYIEYTNSDDKVSLNINDSTYKAVSNGSLTVYKLSLNNGNWSWVNLNDEIKAKFAPKPQDPVVCQKDSVDVNSFTLSANGGNAGKFVFGYSSTNDPRTVAQWYYGDDNTNKKIFNDVNANTTYYCWAYREAEGDYNISNYSQVVELTTLTNNAN